MSLKKMMSVFGAGLLLCTVFRVLQITEIIEYENGFFAEEKKVFGIALSVLIALVCGVVFFLNSKTVKTYENPPKNNIFLSVGATVVAVSLFIEALYQDFPITVTPFQIGITRLVTVFTAIYFIVWAVGCFIEMKIKPIIHIIPIIYFLIKTIFTFIGISPLALISDNAFLMAGYCLSLLFFINYGKLFNGIKYKNNSRKIFGTGFTAAIICISQSVSYFLVNVFGEEKYLHSDSNVIFTLFAIGIYMLGFIISCEVKPKIKNECNTR